MSDKAKNKDLWDRLATTDPRHTKKVEFGRKFTSIDAQWQIMRVTEELGPVGSGWSYTVHHSVERLHEVMPGLVLALADVTIYWGGTNADGLFHHQYGPVRGTSPLVEHDKSGKPRYDDDAPKKAMTDAMTKALSHLGVSADVFLGLFDDNKYVARLERRFAANDAEQQGLPSQVETMLRVGRDCKTVPELEAAWKNGAAAMKTWEKAHVDLVTLRFGEFKRKLQASPAQTAA